MSAIKYRPEIDGLRAVAVVPVVLFHAGLWWMAGGFTGVDVFFVISGFLITSIILREEAAGTFSFANFWMRRIRRILPVMLTVLAATSIVGWFVLYGPQWDSLGQQTMSVIFLCANVFMWKMTGDYWGPAAEEAPLLHCWSLSVEEQFYLFHPLLLILILKFRKQWLLPVFAMLTLASFVACYIGTTRSPSATFYFLPTRAWELAAGCLVAITMFNSKNSEKKLNPYANALAGVGLALVVVGYFVVTEAGFPGLQALLPVIGTSMIILYAGSETGSVTRWLSHPVLIYIGKISYSLYLWHWPVIVFGKVLSTKYESNLIQVGVFVLIPLLSVCSYHFVEQTTRRSKKILPIVGVGTVGCLGLAMLLMWMPWSYDFSSFQPTESFGLKYDLAPRASNGQPLLGVTSAAKRAPEQGDWYAGDGWRNMPDKTPQLVMFGSSHGMMWANLVAECCNESNISAALFNVRAVPPLLMVPPVSAASSIFTKEEKILFDENRLAKLKLWRPRLLLISDRWSARDNLKEYQSLIEFCDSIGCNIAFIGQPPEVEIGGFSGPEYLSLKNQSGALEVESVREHHAGKVRAAAEIVDQLADSHDHCSVIEVRNLYTNEQGRVDLISDRFVLYVDDNHLSEAGAEKARARIKAAITAGVVR